MLLLFLINATTCIEFFWTNGRRREEKKSNGIDSSKKDAGNTTLDQRCFAAECPMSYVTLPVKPRLHEDAQFKKEKKIAHPTADAVRRT